MAPRPRRRALVALATTALAPALVPVLGATPASATTRVQVEVVADGLDNPRGLAFGLDGELYVAESGSGGDGPCIPALGGSAEACLGATGAVTRVDVEAQTQERVVEELPNVWIEGEIEGTGEAIGASDIAVTDDGQLLVAMGLGADPAERENLGDEGALLGTLVTIDPEEGTVEPVADVSAFEGAENPDEAQSDSNPNSVLLRDGEVLVADAGGNTVVSVDEQGEVGLVAVFPARTVPAPPGIPGLPPEIPMQAVPTSLAEGPDGQVLVGQLTGFPFPPGGALVYQIDPEAERPTEPAEFFGGFTNIMDVVQRDDDTFVLEIATNSLLSGPAAVGALARLRPDGTTQRVGQDVLRFPGGMALGPDGALYITNNATSSGEGQVLRINPSLAGDAGIQEACPPDDTAFPPFTDIAGSTHEEAIACAWWWDITRGRAPGVFDPLSSLTRGQTASMLVRAAERTTFELPTDVPDAFDDDDGTEHEDALNVLAAVGVMNGVGDRRVMPDAPVTRAQLAALLVRAGERVLEEELPAGSDAFGDDDGHEHETEIDKAAAAAWVLGVREGVFEPDLSVTRAQASSMLMRAVSTLVEAGEAELPEPVSGEE